jgi:hypothetical protein
MNKKILAILFILILAISAGSFFGKKNPSPTSTPAIANLDSDNDGLLDSEEAMRYGTDKNNPDTDGDGFKDGEEVKNGFNPLGEGKLAVDTNSNDQNIDQKNRDTIVPNKVLTEEAAKENLSKVKIASLYERATDGTLYKRNKDEAVNLLKETKTELAFRGFWRWYPVPESPDNIPVDLAGMLKDVGIADVSGEVRKNGYSHEQLKESISAIKKEMTDIIFVGAIPAQYINSIELNEKTGEILGTDKTEKMIVKPEKWGINLGGLLQLAFGPQLEHFPDITNTDYQNLMLSWAEKQIDDGADAIWIDLLYTQAEGFRNIAGADSRATKESYAAASKIIEEIHKYGESRGKYVYVGTWAFPAINMPLARPDLDFITLTPSVSEISNKKLDEKSWDKNIDKIKAKFGNIPTFVFIDWSNNNTPLSAFSQKLTKKEQSDMLVSLDNFSKNKGMVFVYPVHGGNMGSDSKVRSFGMSNDYGRVYDSLAPEFNTFDTIVELANKKNRDWPILLLVLI